MRNSRSLKGQGDILKCLILSQVCQCGIRPLMVLFMYNYNRRGILWCTVLYCTVLYVAMINHLHPNRFCCRPRPSLLVGLFESRITQKLPNEFSGNVGRASAQIRPHQQVFLTLF